MPLTLTSAEYTHPDYDAWEPKRKVARRHYKADVEELAEADLIRREQGESYKQFDERKKTADYFPAYATVVDAYAGQIRQAEDEVQRTWSDPEVDGGLSDEFVSQMEDDTDGTGTNWLSMRQDAIITAINEHTVWGIVEGPRYENGEQVTGSQVRVISPEAVLDWDSDYKGLVWVKVKHQAVARDGPFDKPETRDRWTIYYRDGYEVYEKQRDETGKVSVVVLADEQGNERRPYGRSRDGGDNGFRFQSRHKKAGALPIFCVKLKLNRYVGYTLAQKNKSLFNKQSERDNILRVANTPKLIYVGTTDELLELQKKQKDANQAPNVWSLRPDATNEHYYMAPPTEPAEIATEVLEGDVERFFVSAFQFYENSVRGSQKTATEIDQDASRGEWSFLNTVATTIDEFERAAMWRLEQIVLPGQEEQWGQATVTTPKKFKPIDAGARAKELAERYFGKHPVPLGPKGEKSAAKEIADLDGIEYDEDELLNDRKGAQAADALRRRRQQLAAQADERALAAEEQINGEVE